VLLQRWMCGDCHRSVVEEDDKRASLGPVSVCEHALSMAYESSF
jgi:transposase-like protein